MTPHPPIPDPILNLARLTAAHEIAPLPHLGRPSLGTRWGQMLRGGMARICLRQLRLRRAKAATRTSPAEDSASEGLRLLRRTLAGFRPSELAFILPEDSVRVVWELSDGDDGLIWADTIQRQLEETCGPFTGEELEAWCNLDATIGDLAALLDKILSENRPIPPPRPSLFARLFARKTNSSPSASCRAPTVPPTRPPSSRPPSAPSAGRKLLALLGAFIVGQVAGFLAASPSGFSFRVDSVPDFLGLLLIPLSVTATVALGPLILVIGGLYAFRVQGGTWVAIGTLLVGVPLLYAAVIWGLRRWWKTESPRARLFGWLALAAYNALVSFCMFGIAPSI